METKERIAPETLSAFLEGLPDLLESLRAQGYGLGTRQHVAAHELVGSLFARGGLPPTLLELDDWLAPLICFTPAQQEDFRERYLQWLIERRLVDKPDITSDPKPVEIKPPTTTTTEPSIVERIVRRLKTNRRPLMIACALLFVAATLFAAYYFAAYYFAADNRKEEDLTRVVVLNPPVPDPAPVALPSDEVNPAPTSTLTPTTTPTPDVGQAWDVDKPAGGTTVAADPFEFKPDDPPPPGFWARNFETLVALTLVPPFAALGLWQVLRRMRRRKDAERFGKEKPRYDKIKVRGVRERVFQSAALRPVARGLRHYLSVESRQLDARSTVLASAGRGGLFTPVYGRRRTLPEYLVLIDRVGFGDQLAQLNSDIVTRLSEHDVYIDTYYFHGDPRRCREGGPDSPQLSLSDLAARHPDHYLLIFSDGTGLISTTTGRPEPFVEQFLYWRGRALLTSIPKLEWEYREWALEREGLKVLPATVEGLRLLVEAVNLGARSMRAPGFDDTPPYPDILREQPTLWKERDEPPPNQTRRLVTHLRRYLGPKAFELLCACAVYPIMQWGVTLFLAYELLSRREVDELLPRLLRLPWFRNGTMPQWLRRVLVRELPRARRRLVRERLEHLLLAFLENPASGLRPLFKEERDAQDTAAPASLLTRVRERLEAWRRSRLLRRRLEHAPARSPLAEPVFLNYITNNQTAEALPAPVRNKLFHRGVAAFGLRLAPAAALVAVAVLTGLFLLLLERPTDDIYTPGAPDDLMSRLLARPPAQTTDPDFTYTPTTVRQGQMNVAVTVKVVTPGEYDLSKMRFAPADSNKIRFQTAAEGVSSAVSLNSETLTGPFVVARDAPLGKTEIYLFEGDKLRARLPFNVAAAGQAAQRQQQQCPNIKVQAVGATADTDQGTVSARVVLVSPPASPSLTYFWVAKAPAGITGGQGTRSVTISGVYEAEGPQTLGVRVGGLPAGCPNTATYNVSDAASSASTTAPAFKITVEPQSVTVCPSNPKLNNPSDSVVKVFTVSNANDRVDVEVNNGAISFTGSASMQMAMEGGFVNEGHYKWNLSGMSPGTYIVTVRPAVASAPPGASRPGVSKTVTVNGCPRDAAAPVTAQAPPTGDKGQLLISFDDKGKPVELLAVDMTVRLVPRGKAPQGFVQAKFVRTFKMSPEAFTMSDFTFEDVPYGDYNLVVSSAQYYNATFPVSVGQPSVEYTGLKLKIRPTGR